MTIELEKPSWLVPLPFLLSLSGSFRGLHPQPAAGFEYPLVFPLRAGISGDR
jgi:hypothetical protein